MKRPAAMKRDTVTVPGPPAAAHPPEPVPAQPPGRRGVGTQAMALAASTGIAQILVAVIYVVAARDSAPAQYGLIVAAIALGVVAAGFLDFGTNTLWVRELATGRMSAEQFGARLLGKLLIAGQIDDTVRSGTSAGPSTPTGAAAHAGQPAIASLGTLLAPLRAGGITVRLVDRVLTDIELDSAVVAADCLVLAHSNEGPSGLVGKAAAAGTRVLAAGAASLKTAAAALPDTATWCPLTPSTLAQALTTCAGQPRPAPRAGLDTLAFADALLGTLPTTVPVPVPGASARPGSEALL